MNALSEQQAQFPRLIWAGLALGALASAALVWFVTKSDALALVYAGGIAVLLGVVAILSRTRVERDEQAIAAPDWSVTFAAIENQRIAIAVTDRANRLVCANSTYSKWFGSEAAPPDLALGGDSGAAITKATRIAWREGSAKVERLGTAETESIWQADAERAGRGDDHLVWRISELQGDDVVSQVADQLAGPFFEALSRGGVEAALVAPDGVIRAAASGFAERATGDRAATLAGQPFAQQLRSDERERIFFSREGRRGPPQVLIHVPLGDLELAQAPGADEGHSLMLLVDSGVGVGGGWEGAGAAATPQLESLLGALPLGLAMTDRDGLFLFGNEAFLRAIGSEQKGLPSFPSDMVVREDKAAISDSVRRYGRGSASSGDMAIRLRHQPDDPVSLGLAGVRGLGEAAVLLSLVDSTEETRLKRQVAQATKMQAIGQLAGGVAHDFNNVLTAIIGYCDLMLLRHTPGDSDYDDIQQIRANSNRAASLTRQLLAFSRQQTLRPEILQLPDVISEVSQLINRLLGEKIELVVRHDRDLGAVRADPQQLEQVIVNLAVNARDAIQSSGGGAGRLSFSTRRVGAKDIRQMGSDIIPPDDYTVLIVQDTGGGIQPELLGKIFDPFFTTKDLGKGTGLGLSTVYGIVKQSGGFIFAENVEDGAGHPTGARFSLYLPVHHGAPEVESEPDEEESASEWSGGGRILLVEDEAPVRAVAERALARAGYTVTVCSDGEEGLAAVANGGEFDLIVSDVVMPGMDGPAMLRAIRQVRSQLPVLFMSGYAEEQLRKEIDVPNMHFMPKPFSVQQISERVGEVLAKARG